MKVVALVVVVLLYAMAAEAQTCPAIGIVCYPADCASQYKQCSGSTFYPAQNCASGTRCYQGQTIFANDPLCSGTSPTVAPTAAPTTTRTPTAAATTRAPTAAPTAAPTTTRTPTAATTTTAPSSSCSLADILTQAQFTALFPKANGAFLANIAGQTGPFTYSNLIQAARSFPTFGCTGDLAARRRELSAFLAQTSHETSGWWAGQPYIWGYYFSAELTPPSTYCGASAAYPCAPGQSYHGRGPLQLSWNYNYGAASQALFGSNTLLVNPQQVATDGVIAFKTAFWFWMTAQSPKPSSHDVMCGLWSPSAADVAAGRQPGFGVVTNIVNGGIECGISTPPQVLSRVGYYNTYCAYFGITTGSNLYCDQMRPFA